MMYCRRSITLVSFCKIASAVNAFLLLEADPSNISATKSATARSRGGSRRTCHARTYRKTGGVGGATMRVAPHEPWKMPTICSHGQRLYDSQRKPQEQAAAFPDARVQQMRCVRKKCGAPEGPVGVPFPVGFSGAVLGFQRED